MLIQFYTLSDPSRPIRSVDMPFEGIQDPASHATSFMVRPLPPLSVVARMRKGWFQNWVKLDLSFALESEAGEAWFVDEDGDRIRLDAPEDYAEALKEGKARGKLAIIAKGTPKAGATAALPAPDAVPQEPPSWLTDCLAQVPGGSARRPKAHVALSVQMKEELRQELAAPPAPSNLDRLAKSIRTCEQHNNDTRSAARMEVTLGNVLRRVEALRQ